MTPKERKTKIKELDRIINAAQRKLNTILLNCKHVIKNVCGRAECNICKSCLGYYCPTSPTLICEFPKENNMNEHEPDEYFNCKYCNKSWRVWKR